MRKAKLSPAQIIRNLRETDSGKTIPEICRTHGISRATFYPWQSLYGGMEISDLEQLKELEEENQRLKQMYAESSLEDSVQEQTLGIKL